MSSETHATGWRTTSGIEAIIADPRPWAAPPESLPFCESGYVAAALSAYHRDDAPVLVRAERGGRSSGTLPLVRRPLVRLGLRIAEIGCPFNPNTILNAPLRDGSDTAAAGDLLEGAFSIRSDTLLLDHLPVACGTAASFAEAGARLGAKVDRPVPARTLFHADVGSGWDAYLATRSGNHRRQIAKASRLAEAAGDVETQRLRGAPAIAAALPAWFEVERRSWQGACAASAMTDADRTFHALLLRHLPEDRIGDLWLVRMGGRPVAALRMLAAPGKVAVHTMHFDAGFKDRSPGLIAFAAMMRAACDGDAREVDMHGTTEFFGRWSTGTRAHASLRLYRPGLRGAALQGGRRLAIRLGLAGT